MDYAKIAKAVVKRFLDRHDQLGQEVIASHPEYAIWHNGRGKEFANEVMDLANVKTFCECKSVVGVTRYLHQFLDDATTSEDKWLWVVETLAQLRDSMVQIRA